MENRDKIAFLVSANTDLTLINEVLDKGYYIENDAFAYNDLNGDSVYMLILANRKNKHPDMLLIRINFSSSKEGLSKLNNAFSCGYDLLPRDAKMSFDNSCIYILERHGESE